MKIGKIFLCLGMLTVLSLSVISPTSIFKTSYGTLFGDVEQQIQQQAEQLGIGKDIAQQIGQEASQIGIGEDDSTTDSTKSRTIRNR